MRVHYGSYTGNGSDSRSITGIGFQPDWVIVTNSTTRAGAQRFGTQTGDNSFDIRDYDPGSTNWPPVSNRIQAMESDGFQVGTDDGVNRSGDTYYWLAVKDNSETNLKQSSYTGNGGNDRDITGSGFQPDFALVKGEWEWSGPGTLYLSTFSGDKSFGLDSPGFTPSDRIQSIISDGFQIGQNESVNQNTYTYHYLTLKADTGTFAVGTYVGNGSDSRNITGVGFQPDVVMIFTDDTSTADNAIRFASQVGDLTAFLAQSRGDSADCIQALQSDGFQVGTDASVNANTKNYYWVAFKSTETVSTTVKHNLGLMGVGN